MRILILNTLLCLLATFNTSALTIDSTKLIPSGNTIDVTLSMSNNNGGTITYTAEQYYGTGTSTDSGTVAIDSGLTSKSFTISNLCDSSFTDITLVINDETGTHYLGRYATTTSVIGMNPPSASGIHIADSVTFGTGVVNLDVLVDAGGSSNGKLTPYFNFGGTWQSLENANHTWATYSEWIGRGCEGQKWMRFEVSMLNPTDTLGAYVTVETPLGIANSDTIWFTVEGGEINFGADSSDTTTAIHDFTTTPITVYPNPTNETLFLSGVAFPYSVSIYTLEGKLVQEDKNVHKVTVADLNPGLYVVCIEEKNSGVVYRSQFCKRR